MSPTPIPPLPAAVAKALALADRRHAEAADAERAIVFARDGVTAAGEADRAAAVAAIERGRPDPGPAKANKARQSLAEAEHHAQAARVVAERARDAAQQAVRDAAPEWSRQLREAWQAADEQLADAIDHVAAVIDHRADLRGAVEWVRGLASDDPRDRRHAEHAGRTVQGDPESRAIVLANGTGLRTRDALAVLRDITMLGALPTTRTATERPVTTA